MEHWRVGHIGIASARFFGHWRVQVYKLAHTAQDQENTHTGIPADNWRELEADAAALMLAAYGTVETWCGLTCPRTLARRATWQHWEEANQTRKKGK